MGATNPEVDPPAGNKGRATGGSDLVRSLDENYEAIAARREQGGSWQNVLDWLAANGVTDTKGRPVSPKLLAATWARVGAIRASRAIRPRHPTSRSEASDQNLSTKDEATNMASNGASCRVARRVAFTDAFAQALEDTDRHSPLYRFMVENHDAIAEKRARYGSWDKFLELVNEAGIRDGQDRPVTVRVLYRTWERVTRAMKASRSRPAARIVASGIEPLAPAATPHPLPPVYRAREIGTPVATFSVPASIVSRPGEPTMVVTKKWQAHETPLEQQELPPGKSAKLSYERAWGVQHVRNDILVESGKTPFATLQQDLVNDLIDTGFAIYLARFGSDATGEQVLAHIAEQDRILEILKQDELKKGAAYGRTNLAH